MSKWLRFLLCGLLAWFLTAIFSGLIMVAALADSPLLSTPRLLVPANDSQLFSSTLTFGWQTVPDADGYLFELQDESSREILLRVMLPPGDTCSAQECTFTIDMPEFGRGAYRWHVAAQIEQDQNWSEWRSFAWYPTFSWAFYHAQRVWLLPLLTVVLFLLLERRVIPRKVERQS